MQALANLQICFPVADTAGFPVCGAGVVLQDDFGGDTGDGAGARTPGQKASANSATASKRRLGFHLDEGEGEGEAKEGGGKRRTGSHTGDGKDAGGRAGRRLSGRPNKDDVGASSVLRPRGVRGWLRSAWQLIRYAAACCAPGHCLKRGICAARPLQAACLSASRSPPSVAAGAAYE